MLNNNSGAAPPAGEDVLLSEARILSEPHETFEPPSRPFPAGNFDSRTAIFRAREAYRERERAKAAAARQSAAAEPIVGPRNQEEDRPLLGDAAEEVVWVESIEVVPPGAGIEAEVVEGWPDAGHSSHWGNGTEADTEDSTFGDRRGHSGEFTVSEDRRRETPEPEPEIVESVATRVEVCIPEPRAPIAESTLSREPRPANPAAELPEWFRADLPRVCRTCRDFRPATDGRRGWCANAWAFTHRQLVQDDDVAPCHSAIGDWWAPVDDVWLVAADVSTHGRATPLLDRLIADEAARRRRS